jgi:hypothetical protein
MRRGPLRRPGAHPGPAEGGTTLSVEIPLRRAIVRYGADLRRPSHLPVWAEADSASTRKSRGRGSGAVPLSRSRPGRYGLRRGAGHQPADHRGSEVLGEGWAAGGLAVVLLSMHSEQQYAARHPAGATLIEKASVPGTGTGAARRPPAVYISPAGRAAGPEVSGRVACPRATPSGAAGAAPAGG